MLTSATDIPTYFSFLLIQNRVARFMACPTAVMNLVVFLCVFLSLLIKIIQCFLFEREQALLLSSTPLIKCSYA